MITGPASKDHDFLNTLRIPSYLQVIYIQCEYPYGGRQIAEVPVSDNDVSYTFSETKAEPVIQNYKETGEIGPECNDCFQVISGSGSVTINGGNIFCVTDSFTGSLTFEGWNGGGTLKVCGTANVSGTFQLGPNCHIIVTQNGNLTINPPSSYGTTASITVYENASLTINGAYTTNGAFFANQGNLLVNGSLAIQNLANLFTNMGDAVVNGNVMVNSEVFSNSGLFTINSGNFTTNAGCTMTNSGTLDVNSGYANISGGTFDNNGEITVDGDYFRLNTGANFTNNGDLTFSSTGNRFEVNGSTLTNRGHVTVTGNMNFNASAVVLNSCGMICTGLLEINSSNFTNNSGFLKGAQEVKINSTGAINLNDKSMISTVNFTYNQGSVVGGGSLNSIKVTGTFSFYQSNTYVSGLIEAACDNFYYAQGNQSTHFINGATAVGLNGVSNYIPVSGCNPDGIGAPQFIDSDGDGVPDGQDDYPNDFYRAFNSYFPTESTHACLVFEDLWPNKGDYDFNDLVVDVWGTEVTNANDDLVEIFINFDVKAVGAAYVNGFGWQYSSLVPNDIESVTGAVLRPGGIIQTNPNGTESGQDSAVIVVVENVEDVINRPGGSMYNTLENGLVGVSDEVNIYIYFGEQTPIDRSLIQNGEAYNIFLIQNQDRSVEIHRPGRVPTDKMNMSLFGTGQDASGIYGPTYYYKTANKLPWALLLMESFEYPIEKIEITEAYLHFVEWAESRGSAYPDWYVNTAPGYRNVTKIWGAD
jgi:LruC domain-containing protein